MKKYIVAFGKLRDATSRDAIEFLKMPLFFLSGIKHVNQNLKTRVLYDGFIKFVLLWQEKSHPRQLIIKSIKECLQKKDT